MRAAFLVSAMLLAAACGDDATDASPDAAGASDAAAEADAPRPDGPVDYFIAEREERYYIIVNLDSFEAWGTGQLTRQEFDDLKIDGPWVKDTVDNYLVVDDEWLRSPDAEADGPTATQSLFGVEFEHIVNVEGLPVDLDPAGMLSSSTIRKYQRVTYPAAGGNHVRLLVSPTGDEFIMINRDPARTEPIGPLPDGWSHRHVSLTNDLTITFSGQLSNIRDSIGDLYQGPVTVD